MGSGWFFSPCIHSATLMLWTQLMNEPVGRFYSTLKNISFLYNSLFFVNLEYIFIWQSLQNPYADDMSIFLHLWGCVLYTLRCLHKSKTNKTIQRLLCWHMILLRVNRFLKWYDKQGHLWKWNVFIANVLLRNIQETWCCGQEEKVRISWSVSNQSISNHTYWCALSSNGDEELVLQKSVFNHVANVHEGHGPLFPRC